jgi:hypothetical protein
VRVWGVVIDRLEDGRIKDTRIIMDTFGMMAQFGVLVPRPLPNTLSPHKRLAMLETSLHKLLPSQ